MYTFFLILSGIFGALIGSFLNVVIYRYGSRSIAKGRSLCFSCGKTLGGLELIPIFSFLFQKGRCKSCKTKISPQYIIVEVVTSILFMLLFIQTVPLSLSYMGFRFFWYALLFSLLIVIFVYDLKHKIIPDALSFGFAALSFISLFFTFDAIVIPPLLDLLAGPLLALIPAALFYISGGKWIGLGDAKLFLGVGYFLGFFGGVSAFVLSFWIGTVVGLLLIVLSRTKKYSLRSEIPFGPFIIIATFIVFFTGIDVLGLSYFFN
jgi:prepilin signal peptidase PulO-like enzyme (type II secretory pathway)